MYQDEFSRYLTDNSSCSWHRVPRLYVDYKLSTSPMGHVCVATPDAYPRQEPFCRFYMPKNNQHIYHPRLFVDKLVNSKENLAKSLPWIKLDIDTFPKIKRTIQIFTTSGDVVIDYEITLTGDVKMKRIGSLSNLTLGVSSFDNVSYNAKTEFFGIAQTMKANFDAEKRIVSVGESVVGPLGTTSYKLSSDGSIEAEYTPHDFVKHFEFHNWLFETQLGYKIKAKMHNDKSDISPDAHPAMANHHTGLIGGGILALILIVCSAGLATPEAIGVAAVSAV